MNRKRLKICKLIVFLTGFAFLCLHVSSIPCAEGYFPATTWPLIRSGQIFTPTAVSVTPSFGGSGAGSGVWGLGGSPGTGGGLGGGILGGGGIGGGTTSALMSLGGGAGGGLSTGWMGSSTGAVSGFTGGGGPGKLTTGPVGGGPGKISPTSPNLASPWPSPGLSAPLPPTTTPLPGVALTASIPTTGSAAPPTALIPLSPPASIQTAINPGEIASIVYLEPPAPILPHTSPSITRNYINLDCMGIYAPVDPYNFAVVNNFFRGGIYTGAVTQVSGNVETITTPVVKPLYVSRPPVAVVDLNSIKYKPTIGGGNSMFSSPFVNIYGPHGELLSGSREAAAALNLLGLRGAALSWQAPFFPLLGARSMAYLAFSPPLPLSLTGSRYFPGAPFGARQAHILPAPFIPGFWPVGFWPAPGLF